MLRRIIWAFCLTLVGQATLAFDLQNMTESERQSFNAAVRAYLLENPEIIFEAVEVFEAREAAQKALSDVEIISSNREEIFNDGRSWVGGNPDGSFTVVEFLDYRCGYCKKAFRDVRALVESDSTIRLVIKEFPILGEESTLASRFAIAIRLTSGGDAYKIAHDELMVLRGAVNQKSLSRIAGRIGVDYAIIKAAMDSPEVDAEIRANYALGQKLSISGTPSFVFQSEMLRGYAPVDTMRQIVNRVRG